jgi:hypothetical protein
MKRFVRCLLFLFISLRSFDASAEASAASVPTSNAARQRALSFWQKQKAAIDKELARPDLAPSDRASLSVQQRTASTAISALKGASVQTKARGELVRQLKQPRRERPSATELRKRAQEDQEQAASKKTARTQAEQAATSAASTLEKARKEREDADKAVTTAQEQEAAATAAAKAQATRKVATARTTAQAKQADEAKAVEASNNAAATLETATTEANAAAEKASASTLEADTAEKNPPPPSAIVPPDAATTDTTMSALAGAGTTPSAPTSSNTKEEQDAIEFANGDLLKYGPTVSLLRLSAARPSNEPARYRDYRPELRLIPPEFGLQFVYRPSTAPWRLQTTASRATKDGTKAFQLMSVGGMLLASIDKDDIRRGSVSLAATMTFFEDVIGLGVGVDLYRGIPVAGVGGPGTETAYTGLLAWCFAKEGEVTPENVFFVVTLGLAPLVNAITGSIKP